MFYAYKKNNSHQQSLTVGSSPNTNKQLPNEISDSRYILLLLSYTFITFTHHILFDPEVHPFSLCYVLHCPFSFHSFCRILFPFFSQHVAAIFLSTSLFVSFLQNAKELCSSCSLCCLLSFSVALWRDHQQKENSFDVPFISYNSRHR